MWRATRALVGVLAVTGAAHLPAQAPAPQRPNPIARVMRASLRGIALTDVEKTNVAGVTIRYKPAFAAVAAKAKPVRVALRTARQAGDTAAAHAARRELAAIRKSGMDTLKLALVDMRAALAPEHQAQFDKNVAAVRRALRNRKAPPARPAAG